MTWEPWPGSIIPAWVATIGRIGHNGSAREFVGVLTLERGGRAKLTLRVEQSGVVVAALGSDERKGIRTPPEAQAWAEIALARLYGREVGSGQRNRHRQPKLRTCNPDFAEPATIPFSNSSPFDYTLHISVKILLQIKETLFSPISECWHGSCRA